ncbi:MAG TPA: polysaccharide biosynthesis C-terminal domain-containing protein [Ohtaekwangia sp.]|nr:polysaccharide biosynthesis C-terminal domain-containing protein [Ohtaekwangia sp.]
MSKIKRLAGETVLYGLGSIVPRFFNFMLVPLHTSVFTPEEYGIVTILFSYTAVVNTVYMFGMETAYFRFATKPGADEKSIYRLTQTVVIAISGVLSLIAMLFSEPLATALDVPDKPQLIMWLAAIMFIDAIVAIPFARLRLQKKPFRFALGKFINIMILVALNVYYLVIYYTPDTRIDFVFLANLIANLFYILFFFKILSIWRPRYDKQITPVIFNYGYPVMLTGLAGMTNEMFSRIMLNFWLPKDFYPGQSSAYAVGVFGASYKFAVIMNLAITSFRYAAEPFFFSNAVDKNSPQLFARINHYFIIVCCFILLGVSINLDILKYFFGRPEYWEGLYIVPILLLAYLFLGVYYNFSVWFKLTDKTYFGTLITIGGMLITIGANYWLIPIAGYYGSSWAALLCYFGMMVACYFFGQKYLPIPYNISRAVFYITVTMMLVYGVNAISIDHQGLALTFHSGVILFFAVFIFLMERNAFKVSPR